MAFANKFGYLVKYALNSTPWSFQSVRCMASSKVFVGGVSNRTNARSLRDAFSSCGKVIDAKVIVDRETGRSRRFGFVTFSSVEEATNAISGMDGKEVDGRNVRVKHAAKKRYPGYEDRFLDIHYNSCIPVVEFILEVCGSPRGSGLDHDLREQWLEQFGYKFD